MLQDTDCRWHDMQLFGDVFTDAVQRPLAAGTGLVGLRQVMFDPHPFQVGWQLPATALLTRYVVCVAVRVSAIGNGLAGRLRHLLGFIEEATLHAVFLRRRRKAFQLRQPELLFQHIDALLQRTDVLLVGRFARKEIGAQVGRQGCMITRKSSASNAAVNLFRLTFTDILHA